MSLSKSLGGGAGALLLVLSLSACSKTESPSASITPTTSAFVEAPHSGPVSVAVETAVPADFPKDVPLPKGQPVRVVKVEVGFAVRYTGLGDAEYDAYVTELKDAGFESAADPSKTDTYRMETLQNSKWGVNVSLNKAAEPELDVTLTPLQ